MARYKKPSRINPISILVFLALAAAAYSVVQFGRPYWRQFKVKQVLKDAAYRYAKFPTTKEALIERTVAEIKAVGVEDVGLKVDFGDLAGGQVQSWAQYTELVKHPVVNKITPMRFSPRVIVNKGGGF